MTGPRITSRRRISSLVWPLRKSAGVVLWAALLGSILAEGQQRPAFTNRAATGLQREEWFYNQRAYPYGEIPADARLKALAEFNRILDSERRRNLQVSSSRWTSIGPTPINTPYWLSPVAGQVSAVAVDPRDPAVVYVGTAAGGVWKTDNGGVIWRPLTDNQPSLAVGSLTLDPSNPDIVYAGTGGPFGAYGAGILKSINGGVSWQSIPGPFAGPFGPDNFLGGGAKILSLAVHPTNGQIVLAAVWRWPQNQAGIFRSIDAGATWTQMLAGPGHYVQFDRTNTGIVYAAVGSAYGDVSSGIYKSVDSGLTWTALGNGGSHPLPMAANIGEITMAAALSNFSTMYVYIDNPLSGMPISNLPGVFKSTDGGLNWTQIPVPLHCCNPLLVQPSNEDIVFGGGTFPISIFRSLDGGITWTDISGVPNYQAAPHADARSIGFSADGRTLYFGDDGGAYKTTNATDASVSWASLNATFDTALFYPGLSIHPSNINFSFGGTQDNGTLNYSGSFLWNQVTCGDGGWSAIDFLAPSTVYATCGGDVIDIQKSTASGAFGSWSKSTSGITTNDRVSFIPPLVMDPSNSQRLYSGTYRVYQSDDAAGSWAAISPDLTGGSSHTITAIAVAPSNSTTVYVGTDDSHLQVTTNATAGASAAWVNRSDGLPPRHITQIAVDPTNSLTAYVTVSGFSGFFGDMQGHVFKTTTGGANWSDISGNLPNIPANDIVVDPDLAAMLYVATDIGVFSSSNGGITWSTLVDGLPRVIVTALKLHRPSRTLRAATYGRSVWDLSVPLGPPSITAQPASQTIVFDATANLSVTASGSVPSYQWYQGTSGDTTEPITGATSSSYTTPGLISNTKYWVRVTNSSGNADSNTATITVAFTDSPLVARSTVIKAVHITELRARIDALRARYGVAAYSYSDPNVTPGVTVLRAVHISEMRLALQDVYDALGLARPTYSTSAATGATTVVADISELRSSVLAIE